MRSIESYNKHIGKVVAHCCSKWLILRKNTLLGPEYLLTPSQCKSDYCKICRPRNLIRLRKQLYTLLQYEDWRFITLTFPDHTEDPLLRLTSLYRQFKRFIQRVKRAYPNVKYVRTVEIHKNGFPHIHMIVNAFIPHAFLRKHWHDCGGGIVDIRKPKHLQKSGKLPGHKIAARYLTEELEKKIQDPHRLGSTYWQAGVKSITLSRNLKLADKSREWEFYRSAENLSDAMYEYEYLKFKSTYDNQVKPSVNFGGNSIHIGYGFNS